MIVWPGNCFGIETRHSLCSLIMTVSFVVYIYEKNIFKKLNDSTHVEIFLG